MKSLTIALALFASIFFSVANADSSIQCTICTYVVPLVEGYLQNNHYTTPQIESALSVVCPYFGAFEQQCDHVVSNYTEQIVKELVSGTPADQICYQVYLCTSQSKPVSKPKVEDVKDDSLQCQICTYAVPLVEEYIKEGNYNETWIEGQLQSVCTFLPAPYSTLCDTMIQTYTSQIIQQLENGTPADQVCQELALCTSSKTTPFKPMLPVAPKPMKLFTPKDDSLQCQICEYAVPLIEDYIQQGHYNTTYIEAQIDQIVCSWLPAPYNTLCNTFVTTYTGPIIDELEKGTPADQVCTNLGLCVGSKKIMIAIPQDNSIQCQICTYAVPLVEEYLQAGGCNQTCIEAQLDQYVCSWLPAPYSALCDTFVNSYTGPIIAELEKGTPASQVCQSLALCNSSSTSTTPVSAPAKKPFKKPMMKPVKPNIMVAAPKDDSLQCQICDYAVPLIEDYIQQGKYNTTFIEAQIQQIVCSWLPAPYNTLCNTFVNTYTEPIIAELEKGTPADQVCQSLGLCINSKVGSAKVQPRIPQDDSLQCQICTYAVPLVEEYLKDGNCNQTCIENQLDQYVCSWLPAPYSSLCDTFINSYTGPIIAELEKGTPADQVCQSLALCTNSQDNIKPTKPKQKFNIL
jgi:hypothetical protein